MLPFKKKLWVGIGLIAGVFAFAQQPKGPGSKAAPDKSSVSQRTETKFKVIWQPVNVKEDLELSSVAFTSPEEGWVARSFQLAPIRPEPA